MRLGKPAAEVEPGGAGRQLAVGGGVEAHRLAAGGRQHLGGLGVVEGERPSARDGHSSGGSVDHRWGPRFGVQLRCGASDLEYRVDVYVLCGLLRESVERGLRVVPLRRRHQPEVARRCTDAGIAGEHPEHRISLLLDGAAHLGGVSVAAGLVEHHARHPHRRVVGGEATHQRADRARGRGDVDDEQHGRVGERRDVGGGGEPVGSQPSVEQPHDALDHRDVGGFRVQASAQEQRRDELGRGEPRVEVAARSTGGEFVVAGVDVVGAALGGGNGVTVRPQRAHEADRHGRLALARRRGGHHQPRLGHHSMPFWPF